MANPNQNSSEKTDLRREVGLWGAVMMGLGSILGTGVFVSLAIGAGVAGPSVILAIALAAVVAICNGLSSAQLAAAHPVSGGTYEYAYRWLTPSLGFTAGWMFLCAKSASAATAALGLSGAIFFAMGIDGTVARIVMAVGLILAITTVILLGIRRSNQTNMVIVGITLASLVAFVLSGFPTAWANRIENLTPFFSNPPLELGSSSVNSLLAGGDRSSLAAFLQCTALMFVAFTGYGRIATLAEEVHHPRRTIPRAVIVTLVISMALYISVSFVGVASVGAGPFAQAGSTQAAPLQVVAQQNGFQWVSQLVALGAITAMLGVGLNLILGLSRVVLAMARRGDLPNYFSHIEPKRASPDRATWLIVALILGLVLLGDVKTTWSFSAFTVLVYYAITNWAAIRMPVEQRLYPAPIAWLGLASCLGLAFWVDSIIWIVGLCLIATGLLWQQLAQRLLSPQPPP